MQRTRPVFKIVENCNGQRQSVFAPDKYRLIYVPQQRIVPVSGSEIYCFGYSEAAWHWVARLLQNPLHQNKIFEMYKATAENVREPSFECQYASEEIFDQYWTAEINYLSGCSLTLPYPGTLTCENIILAEQIPI